MSLTFNEYDEYVENSEFAEYKIPKEVYHALGLSGECGEYVDKIKKIHRDKGGELSDYDRMALAKELGDILWYLSSSAKSIGLDLETIAATNIGKINSRKQRGVIRGEGDDR